MILFSHGSLEAQNELNFTFKKYTPTEIHLIQTCEMRSKYVSTTSDIMISSYILWRANFRVLIFNERFWARGCGPVGRLWV